MERLPRERTITGDPVRLAGSGLAPVYGVAMFAAVVVALIGERL